MREPYKFKGQWAYYFRDEQVTSEQQRLFLFPLGLLSGKAERKSRTHHYLKWLEI